MSSTAEPRPGQPTIREVAQAAGVSPMTVSRTLAGGKNVRPDMQERVLAAVSRLGYHRNENARSLRPGQPSGLIGVAITNLGNPYYGNFALGVEEVAAEHGRRIVLGNTGEDTGRERQLVAEFIGRAVEGLIVVPSGASAAHLKADALHGTPLVLASRRVRGVAADTVVLDDVGGAYRATASLIDAGHTRIAYLGNVTSVFTGKRRFEGYSKALVDRALPVAPELVRRGQQDADAAKTAMLELLDEPHPPTAVFAANNRNAIGAVKAISQRRADGRPVTLAMASFDDFELSEMMPMPVTVVDHDPRELGRRAARLLFDRLIGGVEGDARVIQMPTPIRVQRG
jgi:LacI family transcriptional regulator